MDPVARPVAGVEHVARARSPLALQLAIVGATLIALAFVFAHAGTPPWLAPGLLPRLGLASPLSGMTRSFVALARGDVGAAFSWHPLGPFVFAACVAAVVGGIGNAITGWLPGHRSILRRAALWYGVAACFVIVWARQVVVLSGT